MKVLIVQHRLPYASSELKSCRDAFLKDVTRMIAGAAPGSGEDLELADIGFSPSENHIEVKLYFREKINLPGPVKNTLDCQMSSGYNKLEK